MGRVVCLVGSATLLVYLLVVSVLKSDMAGVVKKIQVTSGFELKVMLVWSLCVIGNCKLNISCVT